jgi:hypothetical protein
MKIRFLSAIAFGLALAAAAYCQDAPTSPPTGQNQAQGGSPRGWQGGFADRAGMGMGAGMIGHGLTGTVTGVAADHYTVKTDTGEIYTVFFSANTRILKQMAGMRERGEGGRGMGAGAGAGAGGGMGAGMGGNLPQQIQSAGIKVGDTIAAMGEVDATAKSVGAMVVMQLDPERAKQMREMQDNYGKTWLMGRVTAIDGVKVTLLGSIDSIAHVFVADENTSFRKRREPITLADLQVGDLVRAEGAVKDGTFVATQVSVTVISPGGTPTVPRGDSMPAPQPR